MTGMVEVRLWGTTVGYLGYAPGQTAVATFEYDGRFSRSNIQISPIMMPCPPILYSFSRISPKTFRGLPGICAESLPDTFGNQLIDLYMAQKKIPAAEVTALDRLLYIGARGMGALEYEPAKGFADGFDRDLALDIRTLAELADMVTSKNEEKRTALLRAETAHDAVSLIRVGSSAGGARSKALVARSPDGTFYDGTTAREGDFSHWLLKFDGSSNADRDGEDPKGITRVEFVYAKIARECGIEVPETGYLEDGGDFHFLIKRFDRVRSGGKTEKLHYASWAALAHADRDTTGVYSYEQLVLLARQLGLGQDAVTELFRRAVFNIVGRNQDDHTKNFGFLMDKSGAWRLSPAFDLTYAFDPEGRWTRVHQIRLSGKQDGFTRDDLIAFGKFCNLDAKKAVRIIDAVLASFASFPALAAEWGVAGALGGTIAASLRMHV